MIFTLLGGSGGHGEAVSVRPQPAVRLPKAYRFSGTEVLVKHFGNGVLLLPIEDPRQTLEAGLAAFEPGFQLSREQPEQQQQRPEMKP